MSKRWSPVKVRVCDGKRRVDNPTSGLPEHLLHTGANSAPSPWPAEHARCICLASGPFLGINTFPVRRWLGKYQMSSVRPDLVAGLTLAAYLLPAGIGDASLAGLPPEAGLYACLFGGVVFWLVCSSKHTVITVTSAISLLMGSSLGALAGGDPSRFGALAAGTALLVAA